MGGILLKRVDTIILLVKDIDTSVAFYSQIVGMSMKFKSPGWAEFVLGDVHLALHRKTRELIEQQGSLSTLGISINFEISDVDHFALKLSNLGVDAIGGIKDYEFGRYFFVNDPDGYIVGFREYKPEYASHANFS
jgi:catechol 2,3-dioxygenase-like lactoylglutathione lyase family enzyme